MKKIMMIPTLTIGALLISSMAFAWSGCQGKMNCDGPRDGRGHGMTQEQHEDRMEHRLAFMEIALDLTADQKKQLEELGEKHWQERQEQRAQMQASRSELRELGRDSEFDEAAFRAKARQHADLKTDMRAGKAAMKQQFFSVLTAEQQAKAEKLWDLRQEKRQGRGDGKGPGQRHHMGHKGGPGKFCNQ